MKFLLNMNLPRKLGSYLKENGHETRHCADIGLFTSSDIKIIEQAKINNEVILTHDLDYGTLLAFSGDHKPSVLIFRIRNTQAQSLFNILKKCWSEIEHSLSDGAIVVIEDATVRIRKLPIN